MQMFCEQANKLPMLPPAKTTFTGVGVSFERAPRTSCHWQDVRAHWCGSACRLRQGGRLHAYFTNICTGCRCLWTSEQASHAAAGELGRASRHMPDVHAHRV